MLKLKQLFKAIWYFWFNRGGRILLVCLVFVLHSASIYVYPEDKHNKWKSRVSELFENERQGGASMEAICLVTESFRDKCGPRLEKGDFCLYTCTVMPGGDGEKREFYYLYITKQKLNCKKFWDKGCP